MQREVRRTNFLSAILESSDVSCEIVSSTGSVQRFGHLEPQFKLHFKNDRLLNFGFDEFAFADAYVNGDIDIEGDMSALIKLRTELKDKVRFLSWLQFIYALLFKSETKINRQAIKDHYQFGNDLYLSFIDNRYRFYSQGIFHSPEETLEEASEHKLENMYKALQLKPGMRLLDIGGGWGGVAEYCGSRGVKVTEITLGEDSFAYINKMALREIPWDF